MLPVVVSISDKYLWALQPFAYLFNKYWGSETTVVVAGYTPPDFRIPSNFQFYSISTPQYPKEKWVDGMMEFLDVFRYPHFALLLEDYWLTRKVDTRAVDLIHEYMIANPNILRGDLTGDRLYAGGMRQVGYHEYLDIIQAPGSQYELSLQAAIWNRDLFLKVMQRLSPDRHSAWDIELDGTNIVNSSPAEMRVIGTRQWPVKYANGMNNGAGKRVFFDGLTENDKSYISGMIPGDYTQ